MSERGFDLSNNNKAPGVTSPANDVIDFERAHAAGYTFGWHKATESTTYVDPYYVPRANAMYMSGISTGAYHYARPAHGSPVSQARFFASIATKGGPIDRFALDLEDAGGMFAVPLSQWAVEFINEAQSILKVPGWFYSYEAFVKNNLGPHTDIIVPVARLWIAAYRTTPAPETFAWSKLDMWQHTDAAAIPGLPGEVDENIAFLPLDLPPTPTDPTQGDDDMLVTDDDKNEYVRALCEDLWGREPSEEEQFLLVVYLNAHGKDLTRAWVYDHDNAVAFRTRRGW